MKLINQNNKVNDIGIRVMLVPLFGIAIPLITRMVPHEQFTHWQIKFSYLYTILIAFVVYEGTRFLYFTIRTYFDWFNKPFKKIIALVVTIPFYVVPVSVVMLAGWYQIFMNGVINWPILKLTTIIILVAVFFLVNLYETVFLVRDVAEDKVKKEQLERAKAEAELEALKNQVDPHFIFNSLNTLSHLIEAQPQKAQLFNEHLADVYRYILHNKARSLVLLKEEMQFIEDYFALLKIRFENAVQLQMNIDEKTASDHLLPPISIQILLENAVKHNEFSDAHPLLINMEIKDEMLVVSNEVRKKMLFKPSSKIGLQNLKERYRLTTGKEILINQGEQKFEVHLPLLKIEG